MSPQSRHKLSRTRALTSVEPTFTELALVVVVVVAVFELQAKPVYWVGPEWVDGPEFGLTLAISH